MSRKTRKVSRLISAAEEQQRKDDFVTIGNKENPLFKTAQVFEQEQGITFVSPGFTAQEVAD